MTTKISEKIYKIFMMLNIISNKNKVKPFELRCCDKFTVAKNRQRAYTKLIRNYIVSFSNANEYQLLTIGWRIGKEDLDIF